MSFGDRFGSTIWAEIELAREGDRPAMNRLIEAYRAPVVQLLRRGGFTASDAEDLAQEVFVEIVEKDLLRKAAPEVGRFRSLIIGVTKNIVRNHLRHLGAKKRGGDRGGQVPIDSRVEGHMRIPGDSALFDQIWVVHLMNRAFKRLEKDPKAKKSRQHEIVRLAILERVSYSTIAERLGLSPGVVRNLLHRGKQKLLDYVREEISTYTSPGQEYEGEVEHIMKLIRG